MLGRFLCIEKYKYWKSVEAVMIRIRWVLLLLEAVFVIGFIGCTEISDPVTVGRAFQATAASDAVIRDIDDLDRTTTYYPGDSVTLQFNLFNAVKPDGASLFMNQDILGVWKTVFIDGQESSFRLSSPHRRPRDPELAYTTYQPIFRNPSTRQPMSADNVITTVAIPPNQPPGEMVVSFGVWRYARTPIGSRYYYVPEKIRPAGQPLRNKIYEVQALIPVSARAMSAATAVRPDPSGCAADETCLLSVYQDTNSHAALCTENTGKKYCMRITDPADTNPDLSQRRAHPQCSLSCSSALCSDALAVGTLSLYAPQNSHVKPYAAADSNKVCCKLSDPCPQKLSACSMSATCGGSSLSLGSFYQPDNSHITSGSGGNQICCSLGSRDVLTLYDAYISGTNLIVEYSKNFDACIVLSVGGAAAGAATNGCNGQGSDLSASFSSAPGVGSLVKICKQGTTLCSNAVAVH